MPTDAELLRAYADEKSEAAFGELVRRQVNLVYAVALRQCGGDAYLAEDVTQRVFADLARKARKISGYAMLGGWLFRSAQFAASDVVRAERRRRAREEEAQARQEISRPTAPEADWRKLAPVLDQAIGELPAHDRDAVVLRFFEGRPFGEIGTTLRLTEDAARMRVERALEKLRVALGRRGITSTTTALGVALAGQAGAAAPAGLAGSVTAAALAGATSIGGVAAALSFMSTTKITVGIIVAAGIFALSATVYEGRQKRVAQAELAAANRERDDLRRRLAVAEKRSIETDVSAHDGQKRAFAASESKPAVDRSPRVAEPESPIDYALDHPGARVTFAQQEVARARVKFDRFFQAAGISAEQQEKFLLLVKNNAEAKLDLYAAERAQGYGFQKAPQDAESYQRFYDMHRQVSTEFNNGLRTLLGSEVFDDYMEYSFQVPVQNTVGELASRLYATDAPLSSQQGAQLEGLLLRAGFLRGGSASGSAVEMNQMGGVFVRPELVESALAQAMLHGGMTNLEWNAPISDLAFEQAKSVLTPTQLAALRNLQAQQLAALQLAPPSPAQTPEIPRAGPKASMQK